MMTVDELNERIEAGEINEVIRVAEARQVKDLSRIADAVSARGGVRLVLLTGASAAGKTTTAKRLCTQLLVNDCPAALHLSTDDYFVGDRLTPRNEKGELDYEHLRCVDVESLAADINQLLRGEEVRYRTFDFVNHAPRYPKGERRALPRGGVIVLEGIHALNPELTEGIDDASKFRVFIEPRPNLDVFAGCCPRPEEARFLRRMVRDNQFRHRNPAETVRLWANVRAGEAKWIEPFRGNAEATFNSYLVYELAALKPYVGGLLERCRRELGDDPLVSQMLRHIETILPISPDGIPGDSILRETIGGSQLEY